jgi:hypothetical protein
LQIKLAIAESVLQPIAGRFIGVKQFDLRRPAALKLID